METQKLLELIKANEEAPRFYLRSWRNGCGTFGCLVGNHALRDKDYRLLDRLEREDACSYMTAACAYGVTLLEAKFLFAYQHIGGAEVFKHTVTSMRRHERDCLDKEAAINRVRKFIYYKLHKAEMLYDERGCIRETARRQEGDRRVTLHVKRQLQTV